MWGGHSTPGRPVPEGQAVFTPMTMVPVSREGVNGLNDSRLELTTTSEAGTRQLGQDIAMAINRGVIHLKGDLGSGKSVLARAMIRQLCDDDELEVPSPTFSLVQVYSAADRNGGGEIIHADLYRIADPSECGELGLGTPDADALAIVEWPENGGGDLAAADLEITLSERADDPPECRHVAIAGEAGALAAIGRSLAIRAFLDKGWVTGVRRARLQGDASTRSYETVSAGGEGRILMNAPRQPDGPVIRDGKPYSQIAHLAEDVSAFVGVAAILQAAGLAVPHLHGSDLEAGLILLEDLGNGQIIDENRTPIRERYLASAAMLAAFHRQPLVGAHKLPNGAVHHVPAYDRSAMLIEAELLTDWYLPRFRGRQATEAEKTSFAAIWNSLIDQLDDSEKRLCMRDFHSPNIIWRDGRQGHDRVGLIDFQDAVVGPSAYDLASLAQDARVDVSPSLEAELGRHYCELRGTGGNFDEAAFRRDYAIMAAQRATKILGIFVRLDARDGKPGYLRHLPRLQDYLKRCLSHPVLADYRRWFEEMFGESGSA